MSEQIQKAKMKLLKAAQLVNQAEGIVIKECGGLPVVHDTGTQIMHAISAVEALVIAEEVKR